MVTDFETERLGANQRDREASDENRPLERASLDEFMRVTNAAFRIAAGNLTYAPPASVGGPASPHASAR